MTQLVKSLPVMQETWLPSPGWEDPLKKGTATHSSTLAWWIPWTLWSMGSQRVRHEWETFTFSLYYIASQVALVVKNSPAKAIVIPPDELVSEPWSPGYVHKVYPQGPQIPLARASEGNQYTFWGNACGLHHPARLLCPWASSGKDIEVVSHSLLQGIFPLTRDQP